MSSFDRRTDETSKGFCKNCGAKLQNGGLFCPECEELCASLSEEFENNIIQPVEEHMLDDTSEHSSNDVEFSSVPNFLCMVLLIGCAFLWFAAPFIAVNLLTFGNQPTAFQLVIGDVTVIGNITQSFTFLAAITSIIGIIVCIISEATSSSKITRIAAILTEIPMGLALFETLNWFDYFDDFFDVLDVLGIGFWGIFILLFIVILASGSPD